MPVFKSVVQIAYGVFSKRNLKKNMYIAYFRLEFKILHQKLTMKVQFLEYYKY